jgi:Flp pilus assembly secretin CpaC
MLKRVLFFAALWSSMALAQTSPETSPSPTEVAPLPEQQAAPMVTPQVTPEPENQPSGGVVDEIERVLREKENAEAAAAARMPPSEPRTHRYTNQPLSRVLRILAEQAGINYIEPNFTTDERISFTLLNLTPLQAFYDVAQSRGFQVVTDGNKYTLRRSDIATPSFYVTKRYRIKNQPAEFLLQPIANFLGIDAKQAAENFPGYPKVEEAKTPQEAGGTSAGVTNITDQGKPRFRAGLPFDTPLSKGGFEAGGQEAVFVERSSNSLVVRATPEQQDLIALEISRLDREEKQILIKTYVVEIDETNSLGAGIDWSQVLGSAAGQGASFSVQSTVNQAFPPRSNTNGGPQGIGTLQGQVTGQAIQALGNLTPGRFFTNGLILDISNLQIVLHGLAAQGLIRTNQSPMTVAKSGMPVTIRADSKQTVFFATAGSLNSGPGTNAFTFVTGLTIDIVARILDGGLIDMNLNPTFSTVTGQSAQPGTNITTPIISTRSTTADVTVRSGQAAVIGGILQDSPTFNNNGIPGLSKIPILGYFFKSKTGSNSRTNLVVIVSPTIIPARNQRRDRLGEGERDMLERSADLPGEPPPLPYGRSGKEVRFMSKSKHN